MALNPLTSALRETPGKRQREKRRLREDGVEIAAVRTRAREHLEAAEAGRDEEFSPRAFRGSTAVLIP